MRLRLRSDVFYMPTGNGVYFRSGNAALTLTGAHVYPVWERLVPHLSGQRRSLEDLLAPLGERQREMVRSVVQPLLEHGFVRDEGEPVPHGLTPAELSAYAPLIEYIACFHPGAEACFERFRTASVLAVTTPAASTGLVQAALEHGLRSLKLLMLPSECGATACAQDQLSALLNWHRERDPLLSLYTLPWSGTDLNREALVASLWREQIDFILFAGGAAECPVLRALQQASTAAGVSLLALVAQGDELLIGPWQDPGRAGCVTCAAQRRAAVRAAERQEAPGAEPGPVVWALGTAALVYDLFRRCMGISGRDTPLQVRLVRADTLEVEEHLLLPVVGCAGCSVEGTGEPDAGRPVPEPPAGGHWQEWLLTHAAPELHNQRFGPVALFTEGELSQLPLFQAMVRTAAPGLPVRECLAAGRTLPEARSQALRAALEAYVAARLHRDRPAVLRSVASGRLVPLSPEDWQSYSWQVASGRTAAELVVRGVLLAECQRLLGHPHPPQVLVADRAQHPGTAIEVPGLAQLRELAPDAELRLVAVQPAACCMVIQASRTLAMGAGVSEEAAASAAVNSALHRLQADGDPLAAPLLPDVPCAVADDDAAWDKLLPLLMDGARAGDLQVLLAEPPSDPVLDASGLRFGMIGYRPAGLPRRRP